MPKFLLGGLWGFTLAAAISMPFAVLFGWLTGTTLNKAKGREMVTSYIMGFFANGLYQLVFPVLLGTVIPMKNPVLMLSSGIGLRNTVDLIEIAGALDRALDFVWNGLVSFEVGKFYVGPWRLPLFTFFVTGLLCLVLPFLIRTRLGQQMRDTYNSHEQVGMFSIAALLVGGATTRKATIWNALLGVLLFHTLFVVSPLAGQKILGIPQVGEYFRVFLAYGVIAVALALHAWQGRKGKQAAR